MYVAPRAGAWIETDTPSPIVGSFASHPVRVRGLKLVRAVDVEPRGGRTPCGCVD